MDSCWTMLFIRLDELLSSCYSIFDINNVIGLNLVEENIRKLLGKLLLLLKQQGIWLYIDAIISSIQ